MHRQNHLLALLATTVLATGALGCSNVNLVCVSADCRPAQAAVTDNKMAVQGQACTANPNAVGFPYKILFIIDVSGSTGPEGGQPGSDPTGGRGRAVSQVLSTYGSNPLVSYAILTFDTEPNPVQTTFTNDIPLLQANIPQVNLSKMYTNYDDTLQAARQIILQDANALSPTELSRTRYDIEFLSDGTPTSADTFCQTQASVLENENQIMALTKTLGVLDIRLSTVFLTGPDVDAGKCDATPTSTLQSMATLGRGTFQALDGNDLKFTINYTSILEPFARNKFYVVNESRVVHFGKLYADSDGDGVSDDDETAQGTDPTIPDTFATGCSDRIKQLQSANPNLCAQICEQQMSSPGNTNSLLDTDADGLHDCEEASQGISKDKADTDGDNLVDTLEVRFGTNAGDAGTLTADTDLDGVTDADEVLQGTDPLSPEGDRSSAYVYAALTDSSASTAAQSCFQFDVTNIQMVQTVATPTSAEGDNRICVYVEQLPQNTSSGDSQVTLSRHCFVANYTVSGGQSIKVPANGSVTLSPSDFETIICGSAACSAPN